MRIYEKQLEGRTHLVVPVTLIVEGVLEGSGGRLFYPADELKKSVRFWLGRPLAVFHPEFSDTVGTPDVFNRQKVGTLFNVKFKKDRLVGEAWIDIDRANSVDDRLISAIQSNKAVEVSTGLGLELDATSGQFKGKQYDAIARNHRPDHLAILPDLKGACSIADGCGLLKNHKQEVKPLLAMNSSGDHLTMPTTTDWGY